MTPSYDVSHSDHSQPSAAAPDTPLLPPPLPTTIEAVETLLKKGHYLADRALATALFLALRLGRPLFLEGEAGVGKTEIAKVLARQLGRRLIRLQCYEGLDVASAVYEWNYPKQMIAIRLREVRHQLAGDTAMESDIFSEKFLLRRPILQALSLDEHGHPPVFLIDELDRTDEPFEAFLLEILSDFQVSIPELGVIKAEKPPIVIVTSNRTREVHDALKRRCFYYWVDYPDFARELAIIQEKLPGIGRALACEVAAFVQSLRHAELFKAPGVAETLDWAEALLQLNHTAIDPTVIRDTLGILLKYQDDIASVQGSKLTGLWQEAKAIAARG